LDWVRLYDSLKNEFTLQAEAMARDMRQLWQSLQRGADCATATRRGWRDFLSRFCTLSAVYVSWAEFIEEQSFVLTDHVARDRDQARETEPYTSTKFLDLATGQRLPSAADGSPHVLDMALLAFRNHCVLSSWCNDALRSSFAAAAAEAEERSSVAGASTSVGSRDGAPAAKRARVDLGDGNHIDEAATLLLRFSELCEVLDVADDPCSNEPSTRDVLRCRYLAPLRALASLAGRLRDRNRDLQRQARANASAEWDMSDALVPATTASAFPVMLCQSEAISSDVAFYGDVDPKNIRLKQLIATVK
jgi:hypothetical protein